MDVATVARMTAGQVERQGEEWAFELYARYGVPRDRVIHTGRARQPALLQRLIGDHIVPMRDGTVSTVEVKTERRHTGNLFLETWSNRTPDGEFRRDGWLFTLRADTVLFFFLDADVCYATPLNRLRDWAFIDGNMYRYPERAAGMSVRGEQKNNTVGHPVPVDDMRAAVGIVELRRTKGGIWVAAATQVTAK